MVSNSPLSTRRPGIGDEVVQHEGLVAIDQDGADLVGVEDGDQAAQRLDIGLRAVNGPAGAAKVQFGVEQRGGAVEVALADGGDVVGSNVADGAGGHDHVVLLTLYFIKRIASSCQVVDYRRMRSYGQYCALARALDVIGDRWALLIVRELLDGPRRYNELLAGLPGVATNLLAERLRTLESSGVVESSADGRYALTAWRIGLREPIYALGAGPDRSWRARLATTSSARSGCTIW